MKRTISIMLVVMLMITGCSFIGKNPKDSDKIIPDAIQTDKDENSAANAFVINESAQNSNNTTAANSTSDNALMASGAASGISSESIDTETFVENGTGKGVISDSNNKESVLITLYYRTKEGLLVPVTRKVTKQEGLAKAAINGLVDQAVTREQLAYYGLYPVLPKGTTIRGLSIKNGNAIIDFSKEFLNSASKSDEQMIISSVVYTLTGFKTISNVEIRVEGKTLDRLVNGTDLPEISNRQNTFINTDETELKDGCVKCDLYYMVYGNKELNYLVPVSKQIEKSEANQIPLMMFSELAKTPSESKYFTSFPEGTKLLSYDERNGLVTLDFSSQISNYGGSEKEQSLLNQIYYTVSQLKGANKVKILIDGKENTLPEGTEVAVAKILPGTINKVIDK
ncbi:GerMN domain-containing protein [Ruminiclostridium herbifermentans]|uniref:GerMN domain-containing protein n=1 Tax=Ruminiclostridium herbifermentans TaxID=2488810 RepID=A0A4U7JLE7_9FIRM|nr:GerMN domain-containing protein [Ruminiclostridium herbifermentans]QNU68272.1 GerMN domain-containing protein [Ruminiclostridium herbifermentans]